MLDKNLKISKNTHKLLDIYRANKGLKTFDEAIKRLLKENGN